jgi:hypothetical protein
MENLTDIPLVCTKVPVNNSILTRVSFRRRGSSLAVIAGLTWPTNGTRRHRCSPELDWWWRLGRNSLRQWLAVRQRRYGRLSSGSREMRGGARPCVGVEAQLGVREELWVTCGPRAERRDELTSGDDNGGWRRSWLAQGIKEGAFIGDWVWRGGNRPRLGGARGRRMATWGARRAAELRPMATRACGEQRVQTCRVAPAYGQVLVTVL